MSPTLPHQPLGVFPAGYGASTGQPSVPNVMADVEACYAWLLTQGTKPGSIIAYGQSVSFSLTCIASLHCCPALHWCQSDELFSLHPGLLSGGLWADMPFGSKDAGPCWHCPAQPPGIWSAFHSSDPCPLQGLGMFLATRLPDQNSKRQPEALFVTLSCSRRHARDATQVDHVAVLAGCVLQHHAHAQDRSARPHHACAPFACCMLDMLTLQHQVFTHSFLRI